MKKPRLRRKKSDKDVAPSRITNETVAEHRERILAGGRKFKYPHQYVRHRLVINAIIISVIVVLAASALTWYQLYKAQNTSEFIYRVTRVLPLPVGSVDGESMRYSDYLMRYRSQELWLSTKGQLTLTGEDGKRQLDFIKRSIIDGLALDTYAAKKARELGVSVSEQEITEVVDQNRITKTGKISQEVYDASTLDTLGFSPSEYRHLISQALLRKKVAYEFDKNAKSSKEAVQKRLNADSTQSLQALSDQLQKTGVDTEYGASGVVPTDNQDGGLSKTASSLKDGQVSQVIQSSTGDGYYFIRRLSGNEKQVSYEYIKVPLKALSEGFATLKKNGKVQEYISVATSTSNTSEQKR